VKHSKAASDGWAKKRATTRAKEKKESLDSGEQVYKVTLTCSDCDPEACVRFVTEKGMNHKAFMPRQFKCWNGCRNMISRKAHMAYERVYL
jgi:hypothetical protein